MDDELLGRARKFDGSSDEEKDDGETVDGFEDTARDLPLRYDNSVAFGGAKVRITGVLSIQRVGLR